MSFACQREGPGRQAKSFGCPLITKAFDQSGARRSLAHSLKQNSPGSDCSRLLPIQGPFWHCRRPAGGELMTPSADKNSVPFGSRYGESIQHLTLPACSTKLSSGSSNSATEQLLWQSVHAVMTALEVGALFGSGIEQVGAGGWVMRVGRHLACGDQVSKSQFTLSASDDGLVMTAPSSHPLHQGCRPPEQLRDAVGSLWQSSDLCPYPFA